MRVYALQQMNFYTTPLTLTLSRLRERELLLLLSRNTDALTLVSRVRLRTICLVRKRTLQS